jgi:spore maturation protein CgeB
MYAASMIWARRFAAETGAECVPLLQCTDPEVFHPDVAAPDSGSSVLFVGNSRGERRPMVTWALAAGLPLDVYGAGWDGVVPSRRRRATYLPHDAVGAAYRSAGVVLNDHWEDMRRDGFLSNRLFDAVAAGARVISDDVLGVEEVFGSAIQVARSSDELAAIVGGDRDVLFGSDRERRARAADVHRNHSFDARARTLLDDAVEVIRRRGLGEGT